MYGQVKNSISQETLNEVYRAELHRGNISARNAPIGAVQSNPDVHRASAISFTWKQETAVIWAATWTQMFVWSSSDPADGGAEVRKDKTKMGGTVKKKKKRVYEGLDNSYTLNDNVKVRDGVTGSVWKETISPKISLVFLGLRNSDFLNHQRSLLQFLQLKKSSV